APTSKTLTEDEVGAITGISFTDIDLPTNAIAQVSLTSQNGTLTLTNTSGINFITGDGSNDKNIVFEGTLAQLNASIGSLNYLSDLDYNGFDLVRVIFNDNGNLGSGGAKSDTAQISIEVTGVNDTVIISTPNN